MSQFNEPDGATTTTPRARVWARAVRMRGWGLIECLLAVALGAILTSLALPMQATLGQKLQRAQARTALAQAAWWLEREAATTGQYPSVLSDSAWSGDGMRYQLSLGWSAGLYVLRATPVGTQAGDPCGALWLNQLGQRGADGNTSVCW